MGKNRIFVDKNNSILFPQCLAFTVWRLYLGNVPLRCRNILSPQIAKRARIATDSSTSSPDTTQSLPQSPARSSIQDHSPAVLWLSNISITMLDIPWPIWSKNRLDIFDKLGRVNVYLSTLGVALCYPFLSVSFESVTIFAPWLIGITLLTEPCWRN